MTLAEELTAEGTRIIGIADDRDAVANQKGIPVTRAIEWMREHGYQTYSIGKIDHREEFVDPRAWDVRVKAADIESLVPAGATIGRRLRLVEDLGPQKRRVADVGLALGVRSRTVLPQVMSARALRW